MGGDLFMTRCGKFHFPKTAGTAPLTTAFTATLPRPWRRRTYLRSQKVRWLLPGCLSPGLSPWEPSHQGLRMWWPTAPIGTSHLLCKAQRKSENAGPSLES